MTQALFLFALKNFFPIWMKKLFFLRREKKMTRMRKLPVESPKRTRLPWRDFWEVFLYTEKSGDFIPVARSARTCSVLSVLMAASRADNMALSGITMTHLHAEKKNFL